jgi:hypothetical protein
MIHLFFLVPTEGQPTGPYADLAAALADYKPGDRIAGMAGYDFTPPAHV